MTRGRCCSKHRDQLSVVTRCRRVDSRRLSIESISSTGYAPNRLTHRFAWVTHNAQLLPRCLAQLPGQFQPLAYGQVAVALHSINQVRRNVVVVEVGFVDFWRVAHGASRTFLSGPILRSAYIV